MLFWCHCLNSYIWNKHVATYNIKVYKNLLEIEKSTWFFRGDGQKLMFTHKKEGETKISKNLSKWFTDGPLLTVFYLFQSYVCSFDDNSFSSSTGVIPITSPGKWMPDTNPMPFPDCSVVTHSNVVMTPSTLTFDISESEDSGSVCDDPFFLKEVM